MFLLGFVDDAGIIMPGFVIAECYCCCVCIAQADRHSTSRNIQQATLNTVELHSSVVQNTRCVIHSPGVLSYLCYIVRLNKSSCNQSTSIYCGLLLNSDNIFNLPATLQALVFTHKLNINQFTYFLTSRYEYKIQGSKFKI